MWEYLILLIRQTIIRAVARSLFGGLFLAATPALGQPPRADRVVTVDAPNLGPDLQAACDRLAAVGGGRIEIPAGSYSLRQRIVIPGMIEIRGAGSPWTTIEADHLGGLVVGFQPTENPANWVPAQGLDSSAPGRLAWRTCPPDAMPAFVSYPWTPLAFGRQRWHWTKSSALVLDWALDLGPEGILERGQLFGGVEANGLPQSFYAFADTTPIGTRPGVRIAFTTADGEATTQHWYSVPLVPKPGLNRFTVQIDFEKATVESWINGEPGAGGLTLGSGQFRPGSRLVSNRAVPFGIGALSSVLTPWRTAGVGGTKDRLDRTFVGLKVSDALLYTTTEGVQARLDGKPLTDRLRYFEHEPSTVALVDWRSPSQWPLLSVPGGLTHGIVVGERPRVWQVHNRLSGFTLIRGGGQPPWGQVLALGQVHQFLGTDLRVIGGHHAVGAMLLGASYPITFRDTSVRGMDAGFYFDFGLARLERCAVENPGRFGVLATRSSLTVNGFETSEVASWSETVFRSYGNGGGGRLVIRDWFHNTENKPAPLKALIWFDAHGDIGDSSFSISDSGGNRPGPGVPTIRLGGPSWAKGQASIGATNFRNTDLLRIDPGSTWEMR